MWHFFNLIFPRIDFIKTKLLNRSNPSNVIIGIVPIIDEGGSEIEDGSNEGWTY